MKLFAVLDTNVIVSALISRNPEAATVKVFQHFLNKDLTALYNDEILKEYHDVLLRPKFKIEKGLIIDVYNFIKEEGVLSTRIHSDESFPDPKDIVFYEVALSKEDAYLVTGNIKHFPKKPIVVTPAEMLEILESQENT
jgi:putative PIN family toxin of toxin-antitoxin system